MGIPFGRRPRLIRNPAIRRIHNRASASGTIQRFRMLLDVLQVANADAVPVALKIWLAIRCARRDERLGLFLRAAVELCGFLRTACELTVRPDLRGRRSGWG